MSRRIFAVPLRHALAAGAMVAASFAVPAASPARDAHVYVGMQGPEILAGRFDARSGALTITGPVAQLPRPTWTIRHPRLPILYSVAEAASGGSANGRVIAFRIDPESGALTRLNEVDAGGAGTTYLALDARSMTLVAANYAGGSVATFAIGKDGSIGPRVSLVAAIGSGPHRRQASSHAHSAMVDPSGRFVLVADLGTDRLYVYPFDARGHTIRPDAPGEERHVAVKPGSGPRHFAFAKDGRHLYLLNELTAEVQVFAWDARTGRLSLLQTMPTNAPDHQGDSSASEILVSADGRFVYVGNRGDNSLVVYAVDRAKGTLSLVQRIAAGGQYPWAFSLHPDGRWLLVANQRSDGIAVFAVDPRSGRLTDSGQSAAAPKPVSVTFLP